MIIMMFHLDIATIDDRVELFKELKLMAELDDHPNIVNLVGACCYQGICVS